MRIMAFGVIAAGGVMFLTDNLSTAIIVMAITCILIFVVHPKTKPFIAVAGAFTAVAVVGISVMAATITTSENFRLRRIITWLDPENHADKGGFQDVYKRQAVYLRIRSEW